MSSDYRSSIFRPEGMTGEIPFRHVPGGEIEALIQAYRGRVADIAASAECPLWGQCGPVQCPSQCPLYSQ